MNRTQEAESRGMERKVKVWKGKKWRRKQCEGAGGEWYKKGADPR